MSSSKGKAKEIAINSKEAVVKLLDQDGNGQIDSVDIILLALKVPGVKIDRAKFLQKEFFKNHPQEVIDVALASTPAQAGISLEEINKIADEVIKFERNAVSGISLALGIPGGVAMAATIPADIAQYYGYMLRAAQKMLYLYGFPELDTSEEAIALDSETMNALTLCLGICMVLLLLPPRYPTLEIHINTTSSAQLSTYIHNTELYLLELWLPLPRLPVSQVPMIFPTQHYAQI